MMTKSQFITFVKNLLLYYLVTSVFLVAIYLNNANINAQLHLFTFTENNNQIIAEFTGDNLNPNSWQITTPIEIEADNPIEDQHLSCDSPQFSFFYSVANAGNNRQDILDVNKSVLYCFKVRDYNDNEFYGSYFKIINPSQLPLTETSQQRPNNSTQTDDSKDYTEPSAEETTDPLIDNLAKIDNQPIDAINQDSLFIDINNINNQITAELTNKSNNQIYKAEQWAVTSIAGNQKCDSNNDILFNRNHVVFESNTITGTTPQNYNQTYCFKATLANNSYYSSITIPQLNDRIKKPVNNAVQTTNEDTKDSSEQTEDPTNNTTDKQEENLENLLIKEESRQANNFIFISIILVLIIMAIVAFRHKNKGVNKSDIDDESLQKGD